MLNQAAGDREILAERPNISDEQMEYVKQSGVGRGLLFFGDMIIPFKDEFPADTKLYQIMTTKLEEVV